jgi:hypothetical protein
MFYSSKTNLRNNDVGDHLFPSSRSSHKIEWGYQEGEEVKLNAARDVPKSGQGSDRDSESQSLSSFDVRRPALNFGGQGCWLVNKDGRRKL